MALAFPNRSRSYDEANRRIRFFGYDGMFEVRFSLEIDALAKAFSGKLSGEGDFLSAFDDIRKKIIDAAEKAYARGKGSQTYTLTLSDFS